MINLIVCAVALLAYLIGAIPVGYIIARLKGISDIRKHGSGNIGATNVSRSLGVFYFFLIFFLDAGKAFLCMQFIKPYFPVEYLYGFAAILLFGNSRSVFLRGSGGKGVATLFGLMCALHMPAVLVLLGVWLVLFFVIKTVGIASIITVASLPIYALFFKESVFFLFSFVAAVWIIWLHRSNIRIYKEQYCAKD